MKFKQIGEDLLAYECYTDEYDFLGIILYSPKVEDYAYFVEQVYYYTRDDLFQITDKIAQLRRMHGFKGMD